MHFLADAANHSTWLQWTLWTSLMTLIMGWVARSRSRQGAVVNDRRLQHPPSTLIIGLAGFLLFAAIAIVSNIFANETTHWWTTAIFVGFALVGLWVIGDYFGARHDLSEEGLHYGRLLGRGGLLRWIDLKSVRFSDAMKWFRLESQAGEVVRVSVMLRGLPEFAKFLLAHAPREAIDRVALPVLRETADGNPPSVWGAPTEG